jgi:hypothetical protein
MIVALETSDEFVGFVPSELSGSLTLREAQWAPSITKTFVPLRSDQLAKVLELSMRSRGSRRLVERHDLSLPCRAPARATSSCRRWDRSHPFVRSDQMVVCAVPSGRVTNSCPLGRRVMVVLVLAFHRLWNGHRTAALA